MWNSPRFCFNSYLELDRTMRMRVRCAAWQLWVSEKFSLLSVVNTRPVRIHNTPRTQFGADTTNSTDVLELIFPVAHNSLISISLKNYECVSIERRDRSVFHYVEERLVPLWSNWLFSRHFPNLCEQQTASLCRGNNRFGQAGANCRSKNTPACKIALSDIFNPKRPDYIATT